MDYKNQFCGFDNTPDGGMDLTTKPYVYLLNPFAFQFSASICIEKCPSRTEPPTPTNAICLYNVTKPKDEVDLTNKISKGDCAPLVYGGKDVLGRCLPIEEASQILGQVGGLVQNLNVTIGGTSISFNVLMSQGRDVAIQVVSDLIRSWPFIVAGAVATLIVCFIWLLLLRWFAWFIVWLSIIGLNLVMMGLTVWLYFFWDARRKAFDALPQELKLDAQMWEVRGCLAALIIVGIVAGVLLLITVAMGKRISIAIQIIKEATKAVAAVPSIIFLPIFTWAAIAALFLYFLWIMVYILTPKTTVVIEAFGLFSINDQRNSIYLIFYHIFGFLWGWAFLSGLGNVIMAGAFGVWYWTLDKRNVPALPLVISIWRAFRYHLGSVALGSLLLALVRMVRLFLWYARRKTKTARKTVPGVEYVFACLQCCMKCVEIIVKWINRNAYIHMAIRGTSFCKSAGSAFSLLVRNALRLLAVDFVAEFVLFISRLAIAAGVFFAAWAAIRWKADELQLNFTLTPAIAIGLEALVIASVFLSVYHMAIDTLFLCFLEDAERNDGSPQKPYYMSDSLKRLIDVKNAKPVKVQSKKVGVDDEGTEY
ncbi:hypothetical protein HK102_001080 [Quaeritorhiza haematococci]|nr:hypothetical protein HK102_001080 [Quaeritorhiza haematococci]